MYNKKEGLFRDLPFLAYADLYFYPYIISFVISFK